MTIEEKFLTINLKKSWIDRPKLKRHLSAANAIRAYFYRHMKASDVKISSGVNELLHVHGSKWVPSRIQVKAIKDGDVVNVLLPDEKMKPKAKKKGLKEKLLGRGDQKEKLTAQEKLELEEFKKKKEGAEIKKEGTPAPKADKPEEKKTEGKASAEEKSHHNKPTEQNQESKK